MCEGWLEPGERKGSGRPPPSACSLARHIAALRFKNLLMFVTGAEAPYVLNLLSSLRPRRAAPRARRARAAPGKTVRKRDRGAQTHLLCQHAALER